VPPADESVATPVAPKMKTPEPPLIQTDRDEHSSLEEVMTARIVNGSAMLLSSNDVIWNDKTKCAQNL